MIKLVFKAYKKLINYFFLNITMLTGYYKKKAPELYQNLSEEEKNK